MHTGEQSPLPETTATSTSKDWSTNWWVVTGGPSVGKTTLVGELSNMGYDTVPEAARILVDAEMASGKTIEQIRQNELEFQYAIWRMKDRIERKLDPASLLFLDRGMRGDSEAYIIQCLLRKPLEGDIRLFPKEFDIVPKRRYAGVFLLDRMKYIQDYARTESPEEAAFIHNLIGLRYEADGYKLIHVPVLPALERAQFVLDHIRSTGQHLATPEVRQPRLPLAFA